MRIEETAISAAISEDALVLFAIDIATHPDWKIGVDQRLTLNSDNCLFVEQAATQKISLRAGPQLG